MCVRSRAQCCSRTRSAYNVEMCLNLCAGSYVCAIARVFDLPVVTLQLYDGFMVFDRIRKSRVIGIYVGGFVDPIITAARLSSHQIDIRSPDGVRTNRRACHLPTLPRVYRFRTN